MYALKNEILEWELEGYEKLKSLLRELVGLYVFSIYYLIKIVFRLVRLVLNLLFVQPKLIRQIEPGRYIEVERANHIHQIRWDR